jgi:hypothetical protein
MQFTEMAIHEGFAVGWGGGKPPGREVRWMLTSSARAQGSKRTRAGKDVTVLAVSGVTGHRSAT